MDVFKTIRPGEPGSLRYLRLHGEKLVAVRYRRSDDHRYVHTTIELIEDTREYEKGVCQAGQVSQRDLEAVAVRIEYREVELRQKAKKAGGSWSKINKVWVMRYKVAVELGLTDRIIPGLGVRCKDVDLYWLGV